MSGILCTVDGVFIGQSIKRWDWSGAKNNKVGPNRDSAGNWELLGGGSLRGVGVGGSVDSTNISDDAASLGVPPPLPLRTSLRPEANISPEISCFEIFWSRYDAACSHLAQSSIS